MTGLIGIRPVGDAGCGDGTVRSVMRARAVRWTGNWWSTVQGRKRWNNPCFERYLFKALYCLKQADALDQRITIMPLWSTLPTRSKIEASREALFHGMPECQERVLDPA